MTEFENDLLCQVEGDAPMGQLMRAYWVPALLSEEIAENDGKPVRVRLFGEHLVAYRDTNGVANLIGEFCPHRGASLVYGRNEKCGLRCLYHGWKLNGQGQVIDMPSEPPTSPLKEKVKHIAYPTKEYAGFIWTYMGNPEQTPEFSAPAFCPNDKTAVSIAKVKIPCNWAQITEGQIDSAHSSSLHSSDMVPAPVDSAGANDEMWLRPSTDRAPRFEVQRTSFGFRYVALRRPIKNSSSHDYARVTVYIAPFLSLIPPNTSYKVATVIVPMDNENSYFYFIAFGEDGVPSTQSWREFLHCSVGTDLETDFTNRRNLSNDFLQDRSAMQSGNYTGIKGIPNQDISMWTSMGRVVNRSHDTLGASDMAVVEFRKLMVEAAKLVAKGEKPFGPETNKIKQAHISAAQAIVPKETNWRTLGAAPEELFE